METKRSISADHQLMIDELRRQLKSAGLLNGKYDTDFNLLRWFQGFNFDMEKVLPKLRYHLRFRNAWDLDHIPDTGGKGSTFMEYWHGYIGGPTMKDNNYVVCADYMGLPDHMGLFRSFSQYEAVWARAFMYESMLDAVLRQERSTGRQSGVAYIVDLQGMKFDSDMIKILTGPFKALPTFLLDHYVELFHQIYVVNVPSFMYHLWKILQPLVAELTAKKIHILGSDWRDQLLKDIGAEALPTQWGGQLELPPSFQLPKLVPKQLYWSEADRENQVLKSDQLKVVQVPAGKSEFLTIKVDVDDQIFSLTAMASGNLGYGIFFSESEAEEDLEKMEMAFPQFKLVYAPSPVPYQQEMACHKPGFYKIWFHNPAWFFILKVWIVLKKH